MAIQKRKQDPAAKLDWGFDWADPKANGGPFLEDGETISTSTWVLSDEDWNVVTDVAVTTDSNTDTKTVVFLGPADDDAAIRGSARYLTNHITTNQSRANDQSYLITFEEQ